MSNHPWHVLQVRTLHEKRIAKQLSVRSIDYFLPLYTELSKWSDRTVKLESPLFPGYFFVRPQPGQRIALISTPGVIRLVGKADNATVTEEEVDRIKSALLSGYVLKPQLSVVSGSRVRVHSGIFAGVEGTVTDLVERCKVIISLTGTEQRFSVETDIKNIELLAACRQ